MDRLISHPAENELPEKKLTEHLEGVTNKMLINLKQMELSPGIISKDELIQLAQIIGISHDIGKATPHFQRYIHKEIRASTMTRHSFISAAFAFQVTIEKGFDIFWAILVFKTILHHHGNIETFGLQDSWSSNLSIAKDQWPYLKKSLQVNLDNWLFEKLESRMPAEIEWEKITEALQYFIFNQTEQLSTDEDKISYYLLFNLLYSLLINADKLDASRFKDAYYQGNLEDFSWSIESYLKDFNNKASNQPNSEINKMRQSFFQTILQSHLVQKGRFFYTISAPTGIGKTFGAFAFANKLRQIKNEQRLRIIYGLPFTSIIDQNYDVYKDVIAYSMGEKFSRRPGRYLLRHHHLEAPLHTAGDSEHRNYSDYLKDRLYLESWSAAMIVTTFVQIFHSVIGYENRFLKKFHQMVNSLIILDEVQALPPEYYLLIQKIFKVMGERFHTYFLLMTATQPPIFPKNEAIEIIQDSKSFQHAVFNRVRLKIERDEKCIADFANDLSESIKYNSVLIVMNTRRSALNLFKILKEDAQLKDYQKVLLTTNLTPRDRKQKIEDIRKLLKNSQEKILLVSTQLIEAGVDLSFQQVWRDWAPLDSIIQVAGRCNRHNEFGELGGDMTLVRLCNDNGQRFFNQIYPVILNQFLEESIQKDEYCSTEFEELSNQFYSKFEFNQKSHKLLEALMGLNFSDGKDTIRSFRLIKDYKQVTVYVLENQESEQNFHRWLELKDLLPQTKNDDERDDLLLKIENLRTSLQDLQLNLYQNDIAPYQDAASIMYDDNLRIYYIPYETIGEIYEPDTGFILRERSEDGQRLSGTMVW
jgi:CRISPR-associated endonuclease/helicase Cas3